VVSLLFALVGFRLAIVEVVVNTFFVTFSFFFFPDVSLMFAFVALVGSRISSSRCDVKYQNRKKNKFDYQTKTFGQSAKQK
jgi:hypothetical protein